VGQLKWSRKKVLVIGGAGFLGLNLVKKLCSLDSEVTVIDDFSVGSHTRVKDYPVNIIKGNVLDQSSFTDVDEADYIFHLGSPSSTVLFNKNPEWCFRQTTEGWMNILNLGRRLSVRKVVFPSSGSVYGRAKPPHGETKKTLPCNLYAVSKLACEQMTGTFENAPPVAILRIFAGYGPGENHKGPFASPVTLFLKAIANDERPVVYGDGNQTRDFVYVDDVIESMLKSAENSFQGVVNVGSGASHSFNEVANLLNDKLKKKVDPYYVPKPSNYIETTLADVNQMKTLLGVDPLTLEEGIEEYCSHDTTTQELLRVQK